MIYIIVYIFLYIYMYVYLVKKSSYMIESIILAV